MSKLVKVPKLKDGSDAEAAARLNEMVAEAQNGLRRIVALGLFCYEIKAQLKHGQFKPWLEANCQNVSYRSLASYMQLTTGVLEKCDTSVKAYLSKVQPLHFSHSGELLLIADAKVPEAAKPLRDKVFSIIDGKSASQLFFEFKQAEDEDDPKPKRGRLKGQGGATKEQRAKAAEREEQERIEALKLDMEDFTKWVDKNGDDKGIGKTRGSKEWNKLKEAVETLAGYMRRLDAVATKGGSQ